MTKILLQPAGEDDPILGIAVADIKGEQEEILIEFVRFHGIMVKVMYPAGERPSDREIQSTLREAMNRSFIVTRGIIREQEKEV